MKPIKTTRFGGQKGDFDYLYDNRYENIEKAKEHLKYEASIGQQFLVKKLEGGVDLYIWQGRDKEPVLVGGSSSEGGFNPNGTNVLGENFNLTFKEGKILKEEGDTLKIMLDDYEGGLVFNDNGSNIYLKNGSGIVSISKDNIAFSNGDRDDYKELYFGGNSYLSRVEFPNTEGVARFMTLSVNNIFADEKGNINLGSFVEGNIENEITGDFSLKNDNYYFNIENNGFSFYSNEEAQHSFNFINGNLSIGNTEAGSGLSYSSRNSRCIISRTNEDFSEYSITFLENQLGGYKSARLYFPNSGEGEYRVLPVSVNNNYADENGNIQLTPESLISILGTATEAQKTQIKSLLGIS